MLFITATDLISVLSLVLGSCCLPVNEIKIWANFTKDKDSDKILCEFRSKEIPIVDVAKKYGGGGHSLACGCTINSKDTIKLIMNDFNKLLKG